MISAFGNVEDSLIAVQQTAEQLLRQQLAVDKARRAYEFAQAQFHAGTINILTVLNTETALFTAQDTLAQVKLTHLRRWWTSIRRSAAVGKHRRTGKW